MNSYYGGYRTRTFTEIFPKFEDFKADYEASQIPQALSGEKTLQTVYYLLYAKYGNSHIANSDENQFKYRLWSNLFIYGPVWEKRLDLQKKLIDLTDEEIVLGSKATYNHAFNPGTPPSTDSLEELTTVDDQNTVRYAKSKVEGYTLLSEVFNAEITNVFLRSFRNLFIKILAPDYPLFYVTEEDNI